MKTTFAFLTHPVKLNQVKTLWPYTRLLPRPFLRSFLKNESFKVVPLKKLRDKQGNQIEGCLLISAVDPDEIRKQDDEAIFNKIIEAGQLSERLGFKILGLGGYYSAIADRKSMLYKHMKVPVTTGSAFTAWCVFESAFKAARKDKLDLKSLTVCVISPANSIGLLCARKFADHAGRIILTGDRTGRLEKVRQSIQAGTQTRIDVENETAKAINDSSIIINADPLNGFKDLRGMRTGSIVCDVSVFERQEKENIRPDITFIDSTVVRTPFERLLGMYLNLPQQAISPQLAETMLLSFRENFVNYSLGNNINPDKLEYIADIASRHGFEVLLPGAEIV